MKKIWFAECLRLALGKGASLSSARTADTRQSILIFLKKKPLCRVPGRVTLGKKFKKIKKYFAECQIGVLGKEIFVLSCRETSLWAISPPPAQLKRRADLHRPKEIDGRA